MRWITLLALLVSLSFASRAADQAQASAASAPASNAAKGDEPEPKLEGIVVERAGGGFMTVTMDGPHLVLRFYDAAKKPIAPDAKRAIVKFKMAGRRPQNRTLILAPDGMSLTHGRALLRPPFVFKAFISLVKGDETAEVDDDDENADVVTAERYTIDYP